MAALALRIRFISSLAAYLFGTCIYIVLDLDFKLNNVFPTICQIDLSRGVLVCITSSIVNPVRKS